MSSPPSSSIVALDRRLAGVDVAAVRREHAEVGVGHPRPDLIRCRFEAVALARAEHHRRPRGGELRGDRFADALRGAGHERHLPVQPDVHRSHASGGRFGQNGRHQEICRWIHSRPGFGRNLARLWWLVALLGAALVVVGMLLIANLAEAAFTLAILVGIGMMISGIDEIVRGRSPRQTVAVLPARHPLDRHRRRRHRAGRASRCGRSPS